jgi:hypothetical protein
MTGTNTRYGEGSDYKIRLYCLVFSKIAADKSDSVFSIVKPKITLTSPNGGENWAIGSTQAITWTSTNMTGTVMINLNKGPSPFSAFVARIAERVPVGNGRFNWKVGERLSGQTYGAGSDYWIHIYNADQTSGEDTSDAAFTISMSESARVGILNLSANKMNLPNFYIQPSATSRLI